jgi:hypothetical protein
MGEMGNTCSILVGKSERKRPLVKPRQNENLIFKWILEKYGAKLWTGFIWLRIGTSDGLLRTRR